MQILLCVHAHSCACDAVQNICYNLSQITCQIAITTVISSQLIILTPQPGSMKRKFVHCPKEIAHCWCLVHQHLLGSCYPQVRPKHLVLLHCLAPCHPESRLRLHCLCPCVDCHVHCLSFHHSLAFQIHCQKLRQG